MLQGYTESLTCSHVYVVYTKELQVRMSKVWCI